MLVNIVSKSEDKIKVIFFIVEPLKVDGMGEGGSKRKGAGGNVW